MSDQILYLGAIVIDGTGKEPLTNGGMLIEDGQIKKVAEADEFAMEGVRVVDLRGKTVMPGLIDAHVHILLEPIGDTFALLQQESIVRTALRGMTNLQKHLRSGVTYLRDLGGIQHVDIELKKCLAAKILEGLGLFVSGKVLTMTGGHAHAIGRECDGVDEARKGAREQLKAGADVIKLMATGGVMTQNSEPGTTQLNSDEMQAAVEEAHKAGKKAAAHVQGRTGALNAVLAGVDSVEHGVFLDDQVIELMLENNVYLVPTLSAPHWINEYGIEHGIPQYAVDKNRRISEAHLESFHKARKAGVKIAMGTDAGTPFNGHDKSAYELKLMVQAGMSPHEAVLAATRTAAELLGISDRYGTLEAGKTADFLVLKDNPLAHIETLFAIEKVVIHGRELD